VIVIGLFLEYEFASMPWDNKPAVAMSPVLLMVVGLLGKVKPNKSPAEVKMPLLAGPATARSP
jgi:hypothetical protein